MAKAIKAAVIAAVVVFVVAFLVINAPAGLSFFAMSTASGGLAAAGMAALTLGTTLLTGLVAGIMAPSGSAITNAENFGAKTTGRAATAPRQIVYGTARVGGTILHMETTGADNTLMHMIVAIAGHEINSLVNIRANDNDLTTTTATVSGETVYTVTNSEYTNTESTQNFGSGRLMRYTFHDGSQTAADGLAVAQLNAITSNHIYKGIAYLYIEMNFDAEKFSGGVPRLTYLVKGKDVYDPRTEAIGTSDLQRSNPALIIRDYLTDAVYGLKALSSEINDTTNAGGFAAAANTCDQNVTLADNSTTERRYTANGITNASANGDGVLTSVLSAMSGKVSYVNGQFNVFAGASQTPSLTITDDDLLEPVNIITRPPSGDLYNSVKAIYVNSAQNYTATDSPVYSSSTFLNADTPTDGATANYAKLLEMQLPFTTTTTMAQRIGRIALNYLRQTTTVTVLTSTQFMRLQPCDWVYVTNSRMGWTSKVFEVISTNLEQFGSAEAPAIGTKLALKEVEAAVWDFAYNAYTTDQAEGGDVTVGSLAISAPTSLSLSQQLVKDGTDRKVDILGTWTNNVNPTVTSTEVAYKTNGASRFSALTVGAGINDVSIPNAVVGTQYNVKIRHADLNGITSPYSSAVNITIAAPTDAPSNPTAASVTTGKPHSMIITYTNPSNSDLKAVKIYRKTANSSPSSDTDGLVNTQTGAPSQVSTWIDGKVNGLVAGTSYYYWVKAVNHSDVNSAYVATNPTAGNFAEMVTADIADDAVTTALIAAGAITATEIGSAAVTTAKIANDAVTTAVIASGAITATEIGSAAVTTAKIANDAVTTALINASAITTTEIADDAISTAKIATNAITATEIAAGTITTTQIAANTIVAGDIAAGTVTATQIAANAITSAKIAANTIVAADIASGTITTTQIAANTIVAGDIAAGTITATQIATDAITSAKILANNVTADEINVSTLSAISADMGTLTAGTINGGTINGTNCSIENITAANISAGSLNANRISLNGTTLSVTSNGLNIGAAVPLNMHAEAESIGSITYAVGKHDLTTTNWNSTSASSYDLPQLLGGSPLTLTIPATATAVSKKFLLTLSLAPVGTYYSGSFIFGGVGYHTANSYTSAGDAYDAPFDLDGAGSAFASGYSNGIAGFPMSVSHAFALTTSTSAATTVYLYGWGGLYLIAYPHLKYTLQLSGFYR